VVVRRFGNDLEISDIELRFAQQGPPNPSHTYLRRGKVYFGFGIYNVALDSEGIGDVEISYGLVRQERPSGLFARVRSMFSEDAQVSIAGRVTSVWSKYVLRTRGPTAHEVVGIDLSSLLSGDYELQITVKDLRSGQVASQATPVKIASELDR
jgi:hypothetical protein